MFKEEISTMKHEYLCSLGKLEDLAKFGGKQLPLFTRDIYFSTCCILHYFLLYW